MSIQREVTLRHSDHRYTDTKGEIYTSVSKLLSEYEHKTDWVEVAGKVAGKGKFAGMDKASVLKLWDDKKNKAANHGTKIHNALERYSKKFEILEEDKDLEPMIKDIQSTYKDYYQVYDECTLYHPKYMVAGTSDKILIPKKNSSYFDIEDFKTNIARGIEFHNKDNKYMLAPVDHLQEANYNRYSLQLSLYAYMMEELTGMKCRSMWLRFVPADNPMGHYKIPCNYMKSDAIAMLEHFSQSKVHQVKILETREVETAPTFYIE